jgi:crossover junction endodeoxyribonuclease RusA
VKLTLPFPPSVNTYWRSPNSGPLAGRTLISQRGRSFRVAAIGAVLEQLRRKPSPLTGDLDVALVLLPPNRARRDIDNYAKAAFDALTHAGVWVDDVQIKRLLVEWGPVTNGGRAEITIQKYIPENRETTRAKTLSSNVQAADVCRYEQPQTNGETK